MTRTYALQDHQCAGLLKLLNERKVCYEWAVCNCSPIERSYQLLENGEWKNIDNCPCCGASMTGFIKPVVVLTNESQAQSVAWGLNPPKRKVCCPKCKHEFEV